MNYLLRTLCGTLLLISFFSLEAQNFNFQLRSKLNFPGQTLANVFGYSQNGREYALIGASKGLVIVDITDPDQPVQITQIPGPDNLWKEIKTYSHYCYVTTEGGGGLQVVDLANLPSDNLPYYSYTGDGAILNALNTIHALHVDTTLGFLYAYGSNLFSGGAVVLDIHTDPYNPTYAGKFDQLGYVHDGYANNDTLYASHIYAGLLSIVDMKNKSNPVLLGTVQTPGKFTHNSWLFIDNKTILTTDEALPSFVASYNIEDPTDIQELDRISTNDGLGSIGHNTHNSDNWAVTSWYTDGVTIADAHKPDNLVFTAWYDTWNGTGPQFEGCWGTYPLFASGTVVATNINPGDFFVLTPTYVRACYLEGKVTSACSTFPLDDVQIDVDSNDPWIDTQTNSKGVFKTGQATPGSFTVTISKPGYITQTRTVMLETAQVVDLDIVLEPVSAYNLSGVVLDEATKMPIANAPVALSNNDVTYNLQTNAQGAFQVNCALGGSYSVSTGSWGYLPGNFDLSSNNPVVVELKKGYYDDFGLELGWTTEATASAGLWTRGEPQGTTFNNAFANPDTDAGGDNGDLCYITGNAGGNAGADDVDNGAATLVSPLMQLAGYDDAELTFQYWFFNAGGNNTPNDTFSVWIDNGLENKRVFEQTVSESAWRFSGIIKMRDYLTLTDSLRVLFVTGDEQVSGHIVEAGVDVFEVIPSGIFVSAQEPASGVHLRAWPNPSNDGFFVSMENANQEIHLAVYNALGQLVWSQAGAALVAPAVQRIGEKWPAGVYRLQVLDGSKPVQTLPLVKQ